MIARNIQKGLLPPGDPVIEGFDVYAVSLPAKEVGGDFYEFITIDDHTVGIGVGDVAGKGVPAALFMAVSGTVLHAKAENQKNPEEVISSMNKILYPKTNRQKSVSLAYCVVDTRTRKVKVANSGLILPIHYSSELSRCEPIAVNGIPIGIVPHITYKNKDVTLKSNDILILQSDGILEARNEKNEIFGIDHFIDVVEENCTLSAKSIVEKILDEVESFIGNNPQSDDITLVVIKAR
jgi:sigma-B regulation protein RsbU (phosphoserine phosphatase)